MPVQGYGREAQLKGKRALASIENPGGMSGDVSKTMAPMLIVQPAPVNIPSWLLRLEQPQDINVDWKEFILSLMECMQCGMRCLMYCTLRMWCFGQLLHRVRLSDSVTDADVESNEFLMAAR